MGKRVVSDHVNVASIKRIRKRKQSGANVTSAAAATAPTSDWNDAEDSSSNDTNVLCKNSTPLANVNLSLVNESPKPVYTLRPSVVNGTILYDLAQKPWRLGRPIGKGNFGEIFLASDIISTPVTSDNAKFVVKIEPHSNGPLFVEIHCLLNTAKRNGDIDSVPTGIPKYIASGSHYFGDARYRFLVLPRFDCDLHSLIKNCRIHQKSVLTLAVQIINVLENLHDKGYCHNDIKAQNLMISKCEYFKSDKSANRKEFVKIGKTVLGNDGIAMDDNDQEYEKVNTTDSGNSSEQERDDDESVCNRKYDEIEEDDEDSSRSSRSIYETPVNTRKRRIKNSVVQYSGSNPVRSCRRQKRNSIYEEMVKSHYLRPTKRISYSEFFNEEASSNKDEDDSNSTDDEYYTSRWKRDSQKQTASSTRLRSGTRKTRQQEYMPVIQHQLTPSNQQQQQQHPQMYKVSEERIFLIDFGLASKYVDNGVHRPFVMDQRRAHDGTLEFTSRDAHMGAHARRSDLECLGYNLIYWSQGYLPWKDAATQHQNEKVHQAKEYLMTDVREMLKQIYGMQVPKYLGEFLQYVGQLPYHERPDYDRCRRIFEREYTNLGYQQSDMSLNSKEIVATCVRVKEEIENKNDIFEINKNSLSIMKNLSVTPFHERTLSNRVSPKNLRSKSDKKSVKKKKFSWAEILSQDPDQIARERAEKEFDREERLSEVAPVIRRFSGRPTYAILQIQNRLKQNGRLIDAAIEGDGDKKADNNDDEDTNESDEDEDLEEVENSDASMSSAEHVNKSTKSRHIRTSNARTGSTGVITKSISNTHCKRKSGSGTATKSRTGGKSTGGSCRSSRKAIHHLNPPTSKHHRGGNGFSEGKQNQAAVNGKPERRTRRCLLKTEEESSSDFSTDMFLYNVWKKISSESILYRGNNKPQTQLCGKK